MNKIVGRIFAILLALFLSVSFPLYAEEVETTATDEKEIIQEEAVVEESQDEESTEVEESKDEESKGEESSDSEEIDEESPAEEPVVEEEPAALESLTIKHQIGDEELPAKTITADLRVLLQTLKEDVIAQTEKQTKPFTIKTEVVGVWREQLADSWGKLPALAITTEIDKEGKGKSNITLPAFKKVLPDIKGEEGNATVDWKGLQGQLTFVEKFADLKTDLTIQGLLIKSEENAKENFEFTMEKTLLKGEFDADLMPTTLDFELPLLKALGQEIQVTIQGVGFKANVKLLEQGIEISAGEFKMKQLQLTGDDVTSTFKDVELKSDGAVEKEGVIYKINTKIGNVTLPKKAFDNLMDVDLSYMGDLELRRLDPEAIKQLQQTAHNLRKQQQNGEIPADMVGLTWFAKLTELAPTLLAKSPELALSQLKLKTADGELNGKILVSIEGTKVSSLEDFSSLMGALQMQADFNMAKVLLQKTMTTD
ncbi:MAG: hypothetical protein BWK79_12020 [Beggiatoa sp. IS2]|nr:MAG: hypothetical protein BWK79_12020 [Beggiatoa sp. IS2]